MDGALGNRQVVDACLTFCGQRPLDLYYYHKSLEHLFWSEKPLKLLNTVKLRAVDQSTIQL